MCDVRDGCVCVCGVYDDVEDVVGEVIDNVCWFCRCYEVCVVILCDVVV